MHTLIVGARGVGKSTLINKIIKELQLSICGFRTKKEDTLAVPGFGSPIYIYDVTSSQVQTPENLLGYCANQNLKTCKEAFDRYSKQLHEMINPGSLIVMDELGFMESSSEDFCNTILSLLDGTAPIIAAVKDKDTDFLRKVREHPNCRCFYITEENRNSLYEEVLRFMNLEIKPYFRKTLILNGSPRPKGNTVTLINELKKHLKGPVTEISAFRSNIAPCVDCRGCWTTAKCVVKDEMQFIYDDDFDNVVIASPVYFSTLPGSLLSVMSRMQPWHAATFFLKDPLKQRPKKSAAILTAGGKGNQENSYHHLSAFFKMLNATGFRDHVVCSPNTDTHPASEDKDALAQIPILAKWLNKEGD